MTFEAFDLFVALCLGLVVGLVLNHVPQKRAFQAIGVLCFVLGALLARYVLLPAIQGV